MNKFDHHLSAEEAAGGHGPYRLLRGVQDGLVRRFLDSLRAPRAAQEARLQAILAAGHGTAFSREHGLDRVHSLAELRQAVPIRSFAEHSPWLDRVAEGERDVLTRERCTMLLETSGTSGKPKWLPVTPSWARGVAEAQQLWVLGMLRECEALSRGRALTIVSGAQTVRSRGGLPVGSNTGRMHLAQPWWIRARYPVPYEVFCLEPPELRQYCILRFALEASITSWTTANPSTILLFSRRLQEWREELQADMVEGSLRRGPAAALDRWTRWRWELRLTRRRPPSDWRPLGIWPLATVNCWRGGPAAYFAARLPEALGGEVAVREVGITASEGFFAIPLGQSWEGGVLWTLGHVLEFVDEAGALREPWELERGERLRLIITTEAGLYRYDLQDLVEVIGHCERTPVVRFVGKAGRFLNSTGEKVTEAQVSEAMRRAAQALDLHPVGFTVRVQLALLPAFEVALDLAAPEAAARALVQRFDQELSLLNLEYESKRSSGRLDPARPLLLPPGAHARHRARRVAQGAPEGQVKDLIVAVDDREWTALLEAAGAGA
jgi:hypothetical protein